MNPIFALSVAETCAMIMLPIRFLLYHIVESIKFISVFLLIRFLIGLVFIFLKQLWFFNI